MAKRKVFSIKKINLGLFQIDPIEAARTILNILSNKKQQQIDIHQMPVVTKQEIKKQPQQINNEPEEFDWDKIEIDYPGSKIKTA